MKRITGSLVVCAAAGAFTAGALFYQPTRLDERRAAPAGTVQIKGFAFGGPGRRGGAGHRS